MTKISVQVGSTSLELFRSDPIVLVGDEELNHHLYHLSSVFWRFFRGYISKLAQRLLDNTLQSSSLYSEALEDVRKLVELPDIEETLSRYEVLFQYRRLLRMLQNMDWTGSYSNPSDVTRKLIQRIDSNFNQARSDQHFVFLNVLQSKRLPKELTERFLETGIVAIAAKKNKLASADLGVGVELTLYSAKDTLEQIDAVFLLRQGLDGYQGMPLEQEL